jgi:hypothetical protein
VSAIDFAQLVGTVAIMMITSAPVPSTEGHASV